MESINVDNLLGEMRALMAAAQGQPAIARSAAPGGEGGFAALIQDAIEGVNARQQVAAQLAQAFELGDPSVRLSDAMVAAQKADISFQAMIQVRNKIVTAYQEIMNMQV